MDVERYLKRIGYEGSRDVTLHNLRQLCWCHATHVPHFTLDLFGGEGKHFDMNKIYHKIVEMGRGGFCFELNGLFGELLALLGFKIHFLQGSGFKLGPDKFNPPFDHLLLKVEIEKQIWIVDVGYGAPSFVMPLQLAPMKQQEEMSGLYRLREAGDEEDSYIVEKRHKQTFNMDRERVISGKEEKISKYSICKDWNILFRFSTIPHKWAEFEDGWNSYFSNPDGFLLVNSFVQIFTQTGIKILWGTKLYEKVFPDLLTERIRFTDLLPDKDSNHDDINNAMKDYFGITLDFKPAFQSKNFKTVIS